MKRNRKGQFVKRGSVKKNPKRRRARRASPRRNPSHARPRATRRRRRRHAAIASNPRRTTRRRRRRHSTAIAANPRRRTRRRGSYRRNPSAVVSWLLVGAAAVVTTVAGAALLPRVVPQSIMARPYLYPALLTAAGVGIGIVATRYGHPILAAGIAVPILSLGGLLLYGSVSAAMNAPPTAANPGRSFRAAHEAAGRINGPNMGALAAYTPRSMGMGAVLQGAGYGTMGAIEAMVGDSSTRPAFYSRAGAQLGAR